MTHFARELTDRAWYHYRTVGAAILLNIDEKTKKAISGTGGTYNPSDPIIIGGAGLELQSKCVLGAGAIAQPGTGKFFVFGDSDYFTHSSPVQRTVRQSPFEALSGFASFQAEAQFWLDTALAQTPTVRMLKQGAFVRIPLRLPDGAILDELVVSFRVGQNHANVPQHLPRMRVVRILKDGTIEPFPEASAPTDLYGWHSPETPASGAAWYAAAAIQTLTLAYESDEKTDTSLYDYALEYKDERGTNAFTDEAGNHLCFFDLVYTMADLRPY